ncbi:MAG: RluA family pseudouridine synthase [Firmicutes bacterium]|nr:RluA family pseudouridine synthase [Bacillota bacterium]
MIKLTIGENQGNQRLDRFLKKYFAKASLGYIYKLIRKDVKVNGKRKTQETILEVGDELVIYISEEEAKSLQKEVKKVNAKKQFTVIYEDENILIAQKPFGLLTHGDGREKKNHLANQVIDYLISTGEYDPRVDRTFTPSPANRLDRNTTGLVIFGKKAAALQELNTMIRERDAIEKIYMTIVSGKVEGGLQLRDSMVKDERTNVVTITADEDGKSMETDITPIAYSNMGKPYTLVEAKIRTGRTHQIRVQLAGAGYPIIGDIKYGKPVINNYMKSKYDLTTQLLHAYKLVFAECRQDGPLAYLQGKEFVCPLPDRFERIKTDIFG